MRKVHFAALFALLLFGVLLFVAHQPPKPRKKVEPVRLALAFQGNVQSPDADIFPYLQNILRPEILPEHTFLRWGHQLQLAPEKQTQLWLEADFVSRADSLAFCLQVLNASEVNWSPAGKLSSDRFAANMEFAWNLPEGNRFRGSNIRCYGELSRI